MGIYGRPMLALLAIVVAMAFAISQQAGARRFETSNQRFRAVWTLLALIIEGTATISCPMTVEGSFHSRTLSKVSGLLIGYVTGAFVRGELAGCLNTATMRMNTETLPWHLQYEGFSGRLPDITSLAIGIINADWTFDPSSIFLPPCRARTEQNNPFKIVINRNLTTGVAATMDADRNALIPLSSFCEGFGNSHFEGRAEVFLQGSTTTRITIRLIQ